MKRLVLISVVGAALGIAAAANARVPVGTLAGTVLDAQGQPVAHAAVTLQTSDGLRPNGARTAADGHFEFARYRAGEYDVRACSNGRCSEWTKHIMIRSNKTTQVTLRLTARQSAAKSGDHKE